MSGYIMALVLTGITAAIAELLSPSEKLAGHIRLVAGLCLLVALLAPVRSAVEYLGSVSDGGFDVEELLPELEGEDYAESFSDELARITVEKTEAWVSGALESRFGIPPDARRIYVKTELSDDGKTPAILRVDIVLHTSAILQNPHEIEAYVTSNLKCPCTVAIG